METKAGSIRVTTGDRVEWVKVSRKGKTISLDPQREMVNEVRDGYVIIKAKNGRRRRIALSRITAINGEPVARPDQSEDENE